MVGCMTPVLLAAGRALDEPDGDDRLLADRALLFVRGGRLSLRPIEADMEISIIPPAVVGRAAFFTGDLIFTRDFVVQEELDALVLTHQAFERLAADHPRPALALAMDTAAELALTVGWDHPRAPAARHPAAARRGQAAQHCRAPRGRGLRWADRPIRPTPRPSPRSRGPQHPRGPARPGSPADDSRGPSGGGAHAGARGVRGAAPPPTPAPREPRRGWATSPARDRSWAGPRRSPSCAPAGSAGRPPGCRYACPAAPPGAPAGCRRPAPGRAPPASTSWWRSSAVASWCTGAGTACGASARSSGPT